MLPGTIRELFTYVDWARPRLLEAAAACSDEALDRPFEMGEGSLRQTLHHLWGAERVWLSRFQGQRSPLEASDADEGKLPDLADLAERFRATAAARQEWLQAQEATSLAGTFTYARPFWMEPGPALELPLDVAVLHVLNHFPHHAAQAVNMLKRLDASPPSVDYIVMRAKGAPPESLLDLATLRRYFAHGDWAHHQVHEAGTPLSEDARNREFDLGPGTLRRIMRHLADAPDWWMDHLDGFPPRPFPAIDESDSWDDLWKRYRMAVQRRDAHLDRLRDADLQQVLAIEPRPGVRRHFPLGVVLLQLCVHGTQHRAQALNMLRHAGATVPNLDVNTWHRRPNSGATLRNSA